MALSCRKCGKSFTGLFSQSGLLAKATIRAFEERGIDVSDICFECCKAMQEKQIAERNKRISELEKERDRLIEEVTKQIKIATILPAVHDKNTILGVVSGYSVVGTGPLASFASAITDLFGMESMAYLEKIRSGEKTALTMAKLQTIKMGGDSIYGMNLSVSEATSGHGMLIISCVGTAVKTEHSGFDVEKGDRTREIMQELSELKSLKPIFVQRRT